MRKNIEIFVEKDYDAASQKAAEIFADRVRKNPSGAFGFATGATPIGMYKELVRLSGKKEVDFARVTAFSLDEYYPIKPTDENSYAQYLAKNLFDEVGLVNRILPNGEALDPALECKRYDEAIYNSGGIKMQLLGLGLNGHIGFNEPLGIFSRYTSHVRLEEETVSANARFFKSKDDVPKYAITMGIYTIMMAEEILLLVTGEAKANILKQALFGLITPVVPASVLQLHQRLTVVTDQAAGQNL